MKSILFAFCLLSIALLFSESSCRKHHITTPADQLPPATQEGKNTLGFLLNGQPWTPKGFNGTANLSLYYDPSYRNGTFDLSCYNRPDNNINKRQTLGFYADSIQKPQTLYFGSNDFGVAFYDNLSTNCDYSSNDSLVTCIGYCKITKLDKVNGIFSGIFEFTLIKKGCDTIKITDGRFDMALR